MGRFLGETVGGDLKLGSFSDGDTEHEQVNWDRICGNCLWGLRRFLKGAPQIFGKVTA